MWTLIAKSGQKTVVNKGDPMDPLAVGILNVALDAPIQSVMFALGGLLTFIGIGYGAIIGMAGEKHKSIGVALMLMGIGIATYPTLSMASVVLGGDSNMFMLGGIDIRPIASVLMIFGSVMMLWSVLKPKQRQKLNTSKDQIDE